MLPNIRHRAGVASLATLLVLSAGVVGAQERSFPNPDSGIRADTPNDPDFDCNEPDDEDGDAAACPGLFDQQIQILGFAPNASATSATYKDAARFGQGQISGIRADRAWKTTIGRPDVAVTVTDTGMRWDDSGLRTKIFLNRDELPLPQLADGSTVPAFDANADGAFNVDDYADDARVSDVNGNGLLDGQDLIRTFSDGVDDDANGYVDDIAGWDFFEDDNDPDDTSSYSSASNHGRGRAREAVNATDDGAGSAGVCPRCQVMPLRVWDTFVSPGDNWAAATVYGADMGMDVQIVALGVLQNTRAAKAATTYAHEAGMALMHVSSDLNTANHNYPTNYVESVYINGCAADLHGLSSEFPGADDFLPPGTGLNAPVQTWFRNSNLTQYGAHAHVCITAVTGSEATGHAGGAAGLIVSAGKDYAEANNVPALSAYEVKQLMTLTAEDVLPENTVGTGMADPANPGWDEYFGYGRLNVGAAVEAVAAGNIPPEAMIETPAWWAILDPEATDTVTVSGHIDAPRSADCTYRLEWAPGVSPLDTDLTAFAGLEDLDCSAGIDGAIADFPLDVVADAFDGARTGGQGTDPNQFVFTVRLVVEDADGRRAEDRKTYFVYHDPTWHDGWPKFVDTGGETSPLLVDVDGNGTVEYVDASSAGELWVYQHDGTPLPSFNSGQPWVLPPTFFFHPDAPGFASGAVPPVTTGFRSPAAADVDGDFDTELVVAAGDGRLFVIGPDGATERELGVDPALSTPDLRGDIEHPKRGFLGSPVIADLDPADDTVDIIAAALDGHIYVWSGATGNLRAGFPRQLRDDESANLSARGELIATPTVADLDGDGVLEIVSGSSEVFAAEPGPPSSPPDLTAGTGALVNALLENTAAGTTRIYALDITGAYVDGWPVAIAGLLPDVLPFVGPQHATAAGDLTGDGDDEVIASTTTGDVHVIEGDGSATALTTNGVVQGGASSESARVLNLFEYAIVADLNGLGDLDVATGGVTAPAAVNLLLVGQNLPFNHVVQAWDTAVPESYLPGWPRATDDYQLLSTPAAADVTGSGTPELLVGTGLYLLHAYDMAGLEAEAFPKLMGGWIFNVPAVADLDGDGLLELVAGTREGYRFAWDLDAPATEAAINEWPMDSHDPCHSNRHGNDCIRPNTITDIAFDGAAITFTAPGDDRNLGSVTGYEIRTADTPITSLAAWRAATPLEMAADTTAAGETVTLAVPEAAATFVALAPTDEAGNQGRFANVRVGAIDTDATGRVGSLDLRRIAAPPSGEIRGAARVTVGNTDQFEHTVSQITLGVTNPSLLSRIDVRGPDGTLLGSASPTGTTTIALDALTIAAGDVAALELDVTTTAATAAGWSWMNTAQAGGVGAVGAATWLGVMLLAALLVPTRRAWRVTAFAAVALTAACGGSQDSRSDAVISVTAISAVNDAGQPVTYTGLPRTLASIQVR